METPRRDVYIRSRASRRSDQKNARHDREKWESRNIQREADNSGESIKRYVSELYDL